MKKTKQLTLFPNQTKKFFGGALLYKKRKSRRPLSKKDCVHLVLRSEWAMGTDSFLAKRHYRVIKQLLQHFSTKFGVRIYQQSINSNHIHLLLRITNRALYTAFIKAVSGQIACQIMGQQCFEDFVRTRKKISKKTQKKNTAGDGSNPQGFWQFRPFSRIVNWGPDFKSAVSYLKQNILEAFGFVNYKPRKNYYSAWIQHAAPVLSTG